MGSKREHQSTSERLVLRPLRHEELPLIMQMEAEAFPLDAYSVDMMEKRLSAYPQGFLVAEVEGKVVGYIIGWVVSGRARIDSMAVSRPWRGKGIGKAMMNHVLRHFENLGFDEVELEARPENVVAIGLYEALGFSLERVIPHYYESDGSPAKRMKKRLNPRGE
jgi:ribosomal-protein-alanine N-acetyltransferase